MIILDTNVLSEPLKPRPEPRVINWLNSQTAGTLFTTAINIAELRAGLTVLQKSKRRQSLEIAINQLVIVFENRVLPFAGEQTIEFAELFATSKKLGRPIDFADCAIAACAMQNHFALATRNTKHFEGLGIELMNPWIT